MAGSDPFAEQGDSDRTVIRPNPAGRRMAAAQPPGAPARPAPGAPDPFRSVPAQSEPFQPDPFQAGPARADLHEAGPFGPDPAAGYGVPRHPPPAPADAGGAPEGQAAHTSDSAAASPTAHAAESPVALAMTGMNRLNATASTLFALVSRIRNRARHMDPEALRRSVVAEVRAFESRAVGAGIDPQAVKVARYAICATIDDVVLNTPWGEQSVWAMQSMVGTFHREVVGGDRFYDLLARLEQDPAGNVELLEFLYMCLSLGFDGRLRVEQGGAGPAPRDPRRPRPHHPRPARPGRAGPLAPLAGRRGAAPPALGLAAGLDRGGRNGPPARADLHRAFAGARPPDGAARGRARRARPRPPPGAGASGPSAAAAPAPRRARPGGGGVGLPCARDRQGHDQGVPQGAHHRRADQRDRHVRLRLGPARSCRHRPHRPAGARHGRAEGPHPRRGAFRQRARSAPRALPTTWRCRWPAPRR